MNIVQNLERASCFFPNKPAIIFEGKHFSYKDLNQRVNRVANVLRGLGIKKGETVALFLPNIPEFVISYFGILKIGAIAVSLNVMLKSDEVSYILNDCEAHAIITTESLCEYVQETSLAQLKYILIAEGRTSKGISLAQLMEKASSDAHAIEMESEAPASILYTSGTTGFPKGATLSHGNVNFNNHFANNCYRIKQNDRLLLYLPLFHCFGQNAILNSAIAACGTIILQRRFDLEQVLQSIAEHQVTVLFGVPTVFIKLLNSGTPKSHLESIRYFFSAAAPMPKEIAQNWHEKYGKFIYEGYGLTETSPFATYNHHVKYKLGSVGAPIEQIKIKIVDNDGYQVQLGELGEIVISGPNVMQGYWNRPKETREAIKNNWFHTGDIGRMDEEGFFYIVDRLKDMINVSGFKVYPTEVENIIYQHPAIAECAVYGVPNFLKGEMVKANIILKPGYSIAPEEMIDFCSQRIANYKIPRGINFVDSLPKSAAGKVLKRVLRTSSPIAA